MSTQSSLSIIVSLVAVAACTEHGSGNQTGVDASAGTHDARPIPPTDAPSSPADAAATTCTSTATCAAAIDLGTISGDTGDAFVLASGYQAAWYVVRVTENNHDALGVPMLLATELSSPASAMYDVFVYLDADTDDLDCATPVGVATESGTTESLDLEWGETGTFANNVDDSRSVSIEIRPRSGDVCAAAAMWQLVVTGDT